MLPENEIKEQISFKYIEALASFIGFKAESIKSDYGTDLTIAEVGTRNENGKIRYFDTGRELKLQIKSTIVSNIIFENDIIKYDLETKTFNDLIIRKKEYGKPLILILFILPDDKRKWVELTLEEIKIRKCAYWYYPNESLTTTENVSSIRIKINKTNILNNKSFKQLFDSFN